MGARYIKYQEALRDFREARQRAGLQELLARVTGKSSRLLSYQEVAEKLKLTTRIERGVQPIPVQAIVGSVDRYTDFTRTFLPRHDEDRERWARVKLASSEQPENLAPIEVYQVGDAYFVSDGNHRVSIARQEGRIYIDARVIQVQTPIPLTPDIQPEELIAKAEYASFLEETGLAKLRPNVDLSLTVPGGYDELREEIQYYGCCSEQEQIKPFAYARTAQAWYDNVYTPAAETIRERGLVREFPNRTVADLYLWVSQHRETLEGELGWTIRPQAAITDLTAHESRPVGASQTAPGHWRKTRLVDRYTERLFMDILVPMSGTPEGWQALEQALVIARREEAQVLGLYVVALEAQKKSPEALALEARFHDTCTAAGITGTLAMETGQVTRKVCERARLADLVVLNISHPPAPGLAGVRSAWRSIISRSPSPLLTVPGQAASLERALVAFDGSLRAREALFVAAYLAERWKTRLTVLTLYEKSKPPSSELDYAREYMELHEIEAEMIVCEGPEQLLASIAEERQVDLVLLGSYGTPAVGNVLLGSTVEFMLRSARCPLFICR